MKSLALGLLLALSGALGAEERILLFDSHILVHKDGRIAVTENITVRAEGREIRRGIYRDLPDLYRAPGTPQVLEKVLTWRTPLGIDSVIRDGHPEPWFTQRQKNGVRIYAGDKDVYLKNGTYTYSIRYHYDRILKYLPDHDELYWNVTGNAWNFPIDKVRALVEWEGDPGSLRLEAYTGQMGDKGRAWAAEQTGPGRALFESTAVLGRYEGLSIVAGWQKGFSLPPSAMRRLYWRLNDAREAVVLLFALLVLSVTAGLLWVRHGIDPEMRPLVPRFQPPRNLPPAAMRVLDGLPADATAFTATIVHTAVAGLLKLEPDPKKKKQWVLHGTLSTAVPGPLQATALTVLDGKGRAETKSVTDAKRFVSARQAHDALLAATWHVDFERNLPLVWKLLGLSLLLLIPQGLMHGSAKMPWFVQPIAGVFLELFALGVSACLAAAIDGLRPGRIGVHWPAVLGLGVVAGFLSLFAVGLFVALAFQEGLFFLSLQALLGGFLLGAFVVWIGRPSQALQTLRDEIRGFTHYLTTTDKRRLEIFSAPKDNIEVFEKMLPYAIALGVAKQFSKRFAPVLAKAAYEQSYEPRWIDHHTMTRSSFNNLGDTLGSSFAGTISSASTPPSEGGSGGSGFSGGGGGSSGGGGGGGGGGGW